MVQPIALRTMSSAAFLVRLDIEAHGLAMEQQGISLLAESTTPRHEESEDKSSVNLIR